MNNLCRHCGVCCKLIPIDIANKQLIRDGIQSVDDDFFKFLVPLSLQEAQSINDLYVKKVQEFFPRVIFFRCKNLAEDNLCTSFDKHEICKVFPNHPMAIIPDECGYYGEIFLKSEELKQKVRKYKEEIIYYETMISSDCKDADVYRKIINSLEQFIKKYEQFGANDW